MFYKIKDHLEQDKGVAKVEAIQYDRRALHEFTEAAVALGLGAYTVRVVLGDEMILSLISPERQHTEIQHGDWLVKNAMGSLHVCSVQLFERVYEEWDHGE